MRFADMRILLTGASGGIGSEMAARLAAQGARLLLTARSARPLDDLCRSLEATGAEVDRVAADLTTDEGRNAVADAARSFHGGINVLINNAGINRFGRFDEQRASDIESLLYANVIAPVLLTRELLPLLRATDRALVVNVGSILGSIGLPGQVGYASSKFALHGFSEALRRELSRSPVGVLYVAPRSTNTSMNDQAQRDFNARTGVHSDSASQVAEQIVTAIGRRRRERFIGWPERLFVKLNALVPRLVDWSVGKQARLLEPATPAQSICISHGVEQ